MITLDREVATQRCQVCGADFTTVQGCVLDGRHPFGLYVLELHEHAARERVAYLAIGLLDRREPEAAPVAVALEVVRRGEGYEQRILDWSEWPFASQGRLGKALDKAEALASPLKPVMFQVAERILQEVPEAESYFGSVATGRV